MNVSADIDMSQVTVQQHTYDPDGQVVRSESTNGEDSKQNQPDSNGQASVAANIPGGAVGAASLLLSGSFRRTAGAICADSL